VPDRSPFLLDPDVVFLNHGSFGAVPRPVFDAYQQLQLDMERQPVEWLQRRTDSLMADARSRLAAYVGCAADELVYFPNPTTAINMVAKSLELGADDEVLTTDHEYGAMDRTWKVICGGSGARYVQAHIPFASTVDEFVDRVWARRSDRTKVLFLSHMTSATALRFPVEELVRRANAAGILTIVDGAHIPGHVPLDLTELGADIYTGANHKWMCGPKGSAFLYARREVQHLLRPLVVSWGWESDHPSESPFVDHHQWQGTRDLAPFLATPAAIDWMADQNWPAMQARCAALLRTALERVNELTGLDPIYADDGFEWCSQLAVVRLPELDPVVLKQRLYDEFRVETPVHRFRDQVLLRISIAMYNTDDDVDALVAALTTLLPQLR
jgi:isopenicillin-N epimerase